MNAIEKTPLRASLVALACFAPMSVPAEAATSIMKPSPQRANESALPVGRCVRTRRNIFQLDGAVADPPLWNVEIDWNRSIQQTDWARIADTTRKAFGSFSSISLGLWTNLSLLHETLLDEVRVQIADRLAELRQAADEEGVNISPASEADLLDFVAQFQPTSRPALVVLDNGNLRAAWRAEDNRQVALQFRGNKEIQFVYLVPRGALVANSAGRDNFDGVAAKLRAENLMGLITDEG